jgi:hypothetical protein
VSIPGHEREYFEHFEDNIFILLSVSLRAVYFVAVGGFSSFEHLSGIIRRFGRIISSMQVVVLNFLLVFYRSSVVRLVHWIWPGKSNDFSIDRHFWILIVMCLIFPLLYAGITNF